MQKSSTGQKIVGCHPGKARILVTTSYAFLHSEYTKALQDAEFRVSSTFGGIECLEQLRASVPELIVLDAEILWGGADGVLAVVADDPGAPIKGHARKGYVIIHGEEVQGVALFDELLRPSRRRPDSMLLYINYIATAPWNRKSADGPGRFRQVGRILVAQSVRESITLGCPGRIGLHSYPSTSPFYDILRFENFGPDATRRGLNYFELRPGAAFDLLSDFGARSSLTVENL